MRITRFKFRRTLDPHDRVVEIDTLDELVGFVRRRGGRAVIHCGDPSRTARVAGLKLVLIYVTRAFYLLRRSIFLKRVEDRLRWGGLDELFEIELCNEKS